MPIIKSAKKAARQSVKRTAHNQQIKKDIKTALKAFKKNPTAENMKKIQSEYDKAAKKGLLKKNTVSRRKAAIAKFAKTAGVKSSASAKKAAPAKKPVAKTTAKPATKAAPAKKAATAKKPAAKAAAKPAAKKAPAKKTPKATTAKSK